MLKIRYSSRFKKDDDTNSAAQWRDCMSIDLADPDGFLCAFVYSMI